MSELSLIDLDKLSKLDIKPGDILIYRGEFMGHLYAALDGVDYKCVLRLCDGESLEALTDDQLRAAGLERVKK